MMLAVKDKTGLSRWPTGEYLLLFSEVGSQSRAEGLPLQMCWILLAPVVHEATPLFSCSPQIRKWPLGKSTRLLGYLIRRWLFIFGRRSYLWPLAKGSIVSQMPFFAWANASWTEMASIHLFKFQFSPRSTRPTIMSLILFSKRFWYLSNLFFIVFSEKIKGHI